MFHSECLESQSKKKFFSAAGNPCCRVSDML